LIDAPATEGPLAEAVTDDAFLGGALNLLQPASGYRAGLDAVLLAAAVEARPGEQILDVGSGVGAAGLAVARRLPQVSVTLIERDPQLAALARSNIARNDLTLRVRVIEADVTRPLGAIPELAAAAETFGHALANPPYQIEGQGTSAGDPSRAAANAMPSGALDRWLRFVAAMVRPGGTATLIHRADALGDILNTLAGRFGGAVVLPLHPREGEPALRLLVQAVKGSRAPLELRPGLVLHNADHSFRSDIEAILRRGGGLPLRAVPQADAAVGTRLPNFALAGLLPLA
jgi:tRNA1(Val) A37 N6-methylase TrmN6